MTPFDSTMFLMAVVRFCFIVVYVGGIVWAIVRWKHHPMVSLLVTISLGTMILISAANVLLPMLLMRYSPPGVVGQRLMLSNVLLAFPQLIAWCCFLTATFGWRTTTSGVLMSHSAQSEPRTEIPPKTVEQRGNPYDSPQGQ